MTTTSKIVIGLLSVGTIVAVASSDDSSNVSAPQTQDIKAEERTLAETPKPTFIPKQENKKEEQPTRKVEAKPKPAPVPVYEPPTNNCHPSYSGCLNPNASDYDCAGGSGNGPYYTGTVQVLGPDVFGLDRDNDGWGCE